MSFKCILVLQIFISFTLPVFPEEEADILEVPRRLLLYFELEDIEGIGPVEQLLLYESLLLKLGRASDNAVILEYRKAAVPATQEEKSDIALSWGADSWIWVAVTGSFASLKIDVSSCDLISGQIVFNYILDKELERGTVELERRFWDEVAASVRKNYKQGVQKIVKTVNRGEVVIQAEPGTRIVGLSRKPLKVGPDGQVSAEMLLPATYTFRAFCRGYYPEKQHFYLDQGRKVIRLDQKPGSRFALNFYLKNFTFPGFDLSYYFIPNFLFARFGLTTFMIGIVLDGGNHSERDPLVSLSLNHLSLSTGIYLNRENHYFRLYLGAGVFTRIITAKEFGIGFEPIAPFGLQPLLGLDFSRHMKRRVFVEYAPLFYLTNYPGLMKLSFPEDYDPFHYAFLDKWVIDFLNFRIGFRLHL